MKKQGTKIDEILKQACMAGRQVQDDTLCQFIKKKVYQVMKESRKNKNAVLSRPADCSHPLQLPLGQGERRPRVAIAMSGGVDSSVAAKLLLNQGYEVVGFMMKLWSEEDLNIEETPSNSPLSRGRENACCDIKGVEDARRVASQLGIPFYLIDARAEFKKHVVDYFIEEYKNLRTPNPCVVCNEKIKFGWLLDFAQKSGCDFLATGHYARIASDSGNYKLQVTNYKIQDKSNLSFINSQSPVNHQLSSSKDQNTTDCHPRADGDPLIVDSRLRGNDKEGSGNDKKESGNDKEESGDDKEGRGNDKERGGNDKEGSGNDNKENGKCRLLKAVDTNKDQSYFLYNLNQEQLSKILFPIGEFTKPEVREMAKKWNLPVHEKKESQEICFIKEKDFREFLHRHIPKELFKPGEIVDSKGNIVGKHDGLINYTIGQRKGIEQTASKLQITNYKSQKKPLYVAGYDIGKNRLIVGHDSEIYCKEMVIGKIHWVSKISQQLTVNNKHLAVKIRYRHPAVACRTTKQITNNKLQTSNKLQTLRVVFDTPQRAITPGQSAVFYSGDEVLGGGIIK